MFATITSALDALVAAQARNRAAEAARASAARAASAETTTTRRGAPDSAGGRASAKSARDEGGNLARPKKGAEAVRGDEPADPVEAASEESFPASDPPAFNP